MAKAKKSKKADRAKGNGSPDVGGVLRRPLLISVGALALAEEQASSMIDSFVKRGEKTRKAGEKYLKKVLKNASAKSEKPKNSKKQQESKDDWILRALHWLNIPTRYDVERLNKKVEAMMKKVA